MTTHKSLFVSILATLVSATSIFSEETPESNAKLLAIKAGRILTVAKGDIKDGVILVERGKITAVGSGIDVPPDAKVIDLSGKVIMPGMIDCHSHIGSLYEIDETVEACTPQVSVIDAFDPFHDDVKRALSSGVTTILLSPGNGNVIGGQASVLKLSSKPTQRTVVKGNSIIKLSIARASISSTRRPTSRSGLVDLLREEFAKARKYADDSEGASEKMEKGTAAGRQARGYGFDLAWRREGMEILSKLLAGKLTAQIHCVTADEIMTAANLISELKLKACLVHASYAYQVADELAKRNIPVICGPLLFTDRDKILMNPGKLAKAGIKVSFCSDAPFTSESYLRVSAAIAAKYGMDKSEALKALTINAAEMACVADRIGSIEVGKDADLLVLDGDPLALSSRIEKVFINGEIVYDGAPSKAKPPAKAVAGKWAALLH